VLRPQPFKPQGKALLMFRILQKTLNVRLGGRLFGLENEELFGSDEVMQRGEFGMVLKCLAAHGYALSVQSCQIFSIEDVQSSGNSQPLDL